MSSSPPQLRKLDYGAVISRTSEVDSALAEIAGGLGTALGGVADETVVGGTVLPAAGSYYAGFHFDQAPDSSSGAGRRIVWHAHLRRQPSSDIPKDFETLRKSGKTVEWLFEILDRMLAADARVIVDAQLEATAGFSIPAAMEATRLIAPLAEVDDSAKLELVGSEYRLKAATDRVGLREFRWSQRESGALEFTLGYTENWELGVRDPWQHQAAHAIKHLNSLK